MNRLTSCGKVAFVGLAILIPYLGLFAQEPEKVEKTLDEWPTHQVVSLLLPRGTYLLEFDNIYETIVALDIETGITLPEGYTFSLVRPGTIDFINSYVLQNTLFITRVIDHAFTTSILCNVITPKGEVKNLVLKVRTPAKGEQPVLAIHFVVEKEPEPEVVYEKDCNPEIRTAVISKERELNESVFRATMVEAIPAFFNHHRKGMRKEYKGARVYFDGIIFARSDAYIYMYSNVRKDECDIIKLITLKVGKGEMQTELVDIFEDVDGMWAYVYRAPLQRPAKGKRQKIAFVVQIWSKMFKYKTILS